MDCKCGRQALKDDTLCPRCRYYANTFNPPSPKFESRRDLALRAIGIRRMMKSSSKVMVVE